MLDRALFRAVLFAILAATSYAQSADWPAGLTSTLQFSFPVGAVPYLGGITFDASGNQLLIAGGARGSLGTVYSSTPVRDPGTSRITGLSPASPFALTPYVDAGLQYHGGVLFWSKYSYHQIGQINPLTGASSLVSLPSAWASTGGLTFIPSGYPNAGTLLVSSFNTGHIYAIPLTPAASGLFNLGTPTLYATMPLAGTEGLKFITSGAFAGHLLVANYAWSRIDVIPIDATTGLPVGGSATPTVSPLVTSFNYAEGLAVDPVTGDLFISTYWNSLLFRVDGFDTFTTLGSDYPSVTVGSGATVNFFVRAGTDNGGRGFVLAASGSGTSPGTQIGPVVLPLNIDAITNIVLANLNTPLFTNFLGTTDLNGAAVATLHIPPIPIGGSIGLDFAGVLLNPIDFATNPVHLTLLP